VSLVFVIPGLVLALVTLTASLAAVFRVGKLKATLDTAERAAKAWEEERNAAVLKAERLSEDVTRLKTRVDELERINAQLQERTDLSSYFARQDAQHGETIEELHAMTVRVGNLATAIETLAVMLRPLAAAS
jgi:DNA repair exonuclease SbcCD ATPase subunit